MERTISAFKGYPSQEAIATMMLRLGICVKNGSAYCGDIELSDSALGRAAGVDRRVARATIDKICRTPSLLAVFSKMRSMSLLSDVAPEIGCTTLEIIPTDAHMPGILADVTATIFSAGVSVRQAVVNDPGLQKNAHLIIVIDGQLPPEYLPRLKLCRGVSSITIR
ncbi:MAG: regulator of amino acid metabolism, contains ACT domain protein [Candidatus Methanomethylophilaceae archaeon]